MNKVATYVGKCIVGLSAITLLAVCAYLVATGRATAAPFPALGSGFLGWLILRPGKRSVKVELPGGTVFQIISDDTGVIRTGITAVSSSISNQTISQDDVDRAIEASEKGTPPLPPVPALPKPLSSQTLQAMDKLTK